MERVFVLTGQDRAEEEEEVDDDEEDLFVIQFKLVQNHE